jgi:hypothetical protein
MNPRNQKLRLFLWILFVGQIIVFTLALTSPVYADDCTTDPLNAADCMRTPGFRQGISVIMSLGAAATTVAVSLLSGAGTATTTGPGQDVMEVDGSDQINQTEGGEQDFTEQEPADEYEPPQEEPEPPQEEPEPPEVDDKPEDTQVSEPPQEEPELPQEEPEPPEVDDKPEDTQVSEPPPEEELPAQPADGQQPQQPGALEQGFNTVKDLVGAAGNIVGGFNDYFTIADSPEKIEAIRRTLQTWRNSPTLQNADDYLKNLRSSNGLRQARVGDALGNLGKGLDVLDALNKAVKICNERGYSGSDAVMRVYAELGKKAITWGLTKNPIVALTDAAVGGATQMLFGAENKIDIGGTVDKTFDAWDSVTQEASDLYHGNQVSDAQAQTQDNLNSYLKRISQQVKDGKITREEGSKRMHRLMDIMG